MGPLRNPQCLQLMDQNWANQLIWNNMRKMKLPVFEPSQLFCQILCINTLGVAECYEIPDRSGIFSPSALVCFKTTLTPLPITTSRPVVGLKTVFFWILPQTFAKWKRQLSCFLATFRYSGIEALMEISRYRQKQWLTFWIWNLARGMQWKSSPCAKAMEIFHQLNFDQMTN